MTIESVFSQRARAGGNGLLTPARPRPASVAVAPGAGFAAVDSILSTLTFHYLGVVVADLAFSRELYTVGFGVHGWHTEELAGPVQRQRDRILQDGTLVAVARLGAGRVVLVQPGAGQTVARDALDRRGEGLFAVGYLVDNLCAALRQAQAHGAVVVQVQPNAAEPAIAYLDGGTGLLLGLHQRGARPLG